MTVQTRRPVPRDAAVAKGASAMRRIVLASVLGGCASAPQPVQLEPDGSVLVEEVRVPGTAGAYTIEEIDDLGEDRFGTRVLLMPHDSVYGTMPPIQLFIYPSDGARLETHTENERQSVRAWAGFLGVTYMEFEPTVRRPPPAGMHPLFVVAARASTGGEPVRVLMYTTRVGERNLKLLASYPASWGFELDAVLEEQVATIVRGIVRRTER